MIKSPQSEVGSNADVTDQIERMMIQRKKAHGLDRTTELYDNCDAMIAATDQLLKDIRPSDGMPTPQPRETKEEMR